MKTETFRSVLKKDGYSKEEQYFARADRTAPAPRVILRKPEAKPALVEPAVKGPVKGALSRWETDGGKISDIMTEKNAKKNQNSDE